MDERGVKTVDCVVNELSDERESVVLDLRRLAAQLDEIDRQIADRAWRRERRSASLTAEHARLTARLRRSADRLRQLDERLHTF
jgi:seryl-tRNA synthetase